MIDFRYHIVSLIAVFLALGLGVLMGTTVLDRVTVDTLRGQIRNVSQAADRARGDARDAQRERDAALTLSEQLSPWILQGLLSEQRVVFVSDAGSASWREETREAFERAGAEPVGSLTLTDKWRLSEDGAREELVGAITDVTLAFDPGEDPAGAALRFLGARLIEPTGRELVSKLVEAGFLQLNTPEPTQEWPPPGSSIVGLASSRSDASPQPQWLASFLEGAAEIAAVLAVAAEPDDHSAVAVLREREERPPTLSTFDSGQFDPTGVGSVLALQAAIERRGGHYGLARDLRFVPEAPVPTPEPDPPAPQP